MKNRLDIRKEKHDQLLVMFLNGRLDAHWSAFLAEELDAGIRAGQYDICLDFKGVDYLSSAGIRILVKSYKELNKVEGSFFITNVSDGVASVLNLVGLDKIIREEMPEISQQTEKSSSTEDDGWNFYRNTLHPEEEMKLHFTGNPSGIKDGEVNKKLQIKTFDSPTYGLGLGAIGDHDTDARQRLGEFIGLGNAVAYLPTDQNKSPDYTLKTGKMIPEIRYSYGMFFYQGFTDFIRFETARRGESIKLHTLLDQLFSITGYSSLAMVMIAETSGLVGASLNVPPGSGDGKALFSFPEIRENLHYTIEPAHNEQMAVVTGFATHTRKDIFTKFCRPMKKGSGVLSHFHAAVFSFQPLKKSNPDPSEAIAGLIENERFYNILHLINDERETVGVGESEFIAGTCWVAEVNSIEIS